MATSSSSARNRIFRTSVRRSPNTICAAKRPSRKPWCGPLAFTRENRIDTRFGVAATRVNPAERQVDLTTGESVRYDKLLIATGVRNRRPADSRLGPAERLQSPLGRMTRMPSARRLCLAAQQPSIGMGFIGCEVAASLRQKGVEVVCIDPSPTPLFRVLGEQVGAGHVSHSPRARRRDVLQRYRHAL